MSRIDPAEFDRLARRRQDARKALADAEVKQREATVGVRTAEDEVYKADTEFYEYVDKHAPVPGGGIASKQPGPQRPDSTSLAPMPRDPRNTDPIDFPSPWPAKWAQMSGREKLQAISEEVRANRERWACCNGWKVTEGQGHSTDCVWGRGPKITDWKG